MLQKGLENTTQQLLFFAKYPSMRLKKIVKSANKKKPNHHHWKLAEPKSLKESFYHPMNAGFVPWSLINMRVKSITLLSTMNVTFATNVSTTHYKEGIIIWKIIHTLDVNFVESISKHLKKEGNISSMTIHTMDVNFV